MSVFLLLLQEASAASVKWTETDDEVVLQNGYTYVSFNKLNNAIDKISADFSGSGSFQHNNLAQPFALKVLLTEESKLSRQARCVSSKKSKIQVKWLEQTEKFSSFQVSNILDRSGADCATSDANAKSADEDPVVSEEWTITLKEGERSVTVDIRSEVLRDAAVQYILHGVYSQSPSLYGLFPQGVAQMMGNTNTCMGSAQPLSRAYMLGDGAALDVVRHNYREAYAFNADITDTATTVTASKRTGASSVVLVSAHDGFGSGIEDVLVGAYPDLSTKMITAWGRNCWGGAASTAVVQGQSWEFALTFIPNNYDFPAYLLNDVAATAATVPFDQLRAYLTGIYASPVGCLQSYYDKQFGTIAPTISHPEVGYAPDTNFFDPDNFISLSAMLYSGDAYLTRQVRDVLMRTAQTMCGIGGDQDLMYCNATVGASMMKTVTDTTSDNSNHQLQQQQQHTLNRHGRALFSTSRFNYSALDSVHAKGESCV